MIGLGAADSAMLYNVAARGRRVIGFEQFEPGNARSSSHGESRIIPLSYFEHPSYVPLLRRAYEVWRSFEQIDGGAAGSLPRITGIMGSCHPGSTVVRNSLASSHLHDLPHEPMSGADASRCSSGCRAIGMRSFSPTAASCGRRRRSTASSPPPGTRRGGALSNEGLGDRADAQRDPRAHRRRDDRGRQRHRRGRLMDRRFAPRLAQSLRSPARSSAGSAALAGALHARCLPDVHSRVGRRPYLMAFRILLYGRQVGLACARSHAGAHGRAHRSENDDEREIASMLHCYPPGVGGPATQMMTCLCTPTRDGHFLVDTAPKDPRIVLASPCSGHGFEFASLLGGILVDLAQYVSTDHDIGLFRFRDAVPAP